MPRTTTMLPGHFEHVKRTAEAFAFAQLTRDAAIVYAVRMGADRHTVALSAGLSKSRVDQIARGFDSPYCDHSGPA